MEPLIWYVILGIIIFILIIVIYTIINLGGKSFWNYIKAKFKGKKPTGGWFLKINNNNRVSIEYREIPGNRKIKLKSGKDKAQELYADLNDVKMFKDEDGCPVYMLKEDLPFPLFIKKFNFDITLDKLNAIKRFIKTLKFSKSHEQKRELILESSNFLIELRLDAAYLKDAQDVITNIENWNCDTEKNQDLDKLYGLFEELEDILNSRNYSFVNIADIFKSNEYIAANQRNLINMFYTGYYEGLRSGLAWKDILIIILIVVCIGVSGYGVYKNMKTAEKIDAINYKTDVMYKVLDLLPKDINGQVIVVPMQDITQEQIIADNTNINEK